MPKSGNNSVTHLGRGEWFIIICTTALIAFHVVAALLPIPQSFLDITIRDPLFYDPALEIDKLDRALENLSEIENKLLSMIPKENAELYPDGFKIFPTAFIKTFAGVKEKTEPITNRRGSWLDAYMLIREYDKAISAYHAHIKVHLSLMEKLLRQDPKIINTTFLFPASETSIKTMLSDISLFAANADTLKAEVQKRKLCLFGFGCTTALEDSKSSRLRAEARLKINDAETTASTPRFTNKQVILPSTRLVESRGPYSVSTSCWGQRGGEPKTHNLYLYQYDTGIFLASADEQYFLDHEATKELKKTEVSKLFKKRNSRYQYQLTNTYTCNDNTYIPMVFLLDWMKREIIEKPSLIKEVYSLEKEFLSNSNIHTRSLAPLLAAYEKGDHTAKNNEESAKLEKKRLAIQSRLFGLPYIINHMANFELTTLYFEFEKVGLVDKELLLVLRGNHSVLLLPFSNSVWRLTNSPQYLKIGGIDMKIGNPTHYKTYDDLLASGLNEKDIENIKNVSIELTSRLIEE